MLRPQLACAVGDALLQRLLERVPLSDLVGAKIDLRLAIANPRT